MNDEAKRPVPPASLPLRFHWRETDASSYAAIAFLCLYIALRLTRDWALPGYRSGYGTGHFIYLSALGVAFLLWIIFCAPNDVSIELADRLRYDRRSPRRQEKADLPLEIITGVYLINSSPDFLGSRDSIWLECRGRSDIQIPSLEFRDDRMSAEIYLEALAKVLKCPVVRGPTSRRMDTAIRRWYVVCIGLAVLGAVAAEQFGLFSW